MWVKLAIVIVLLGVFVYLSRKVFTSSAWKRYQLRRASMMAARGEIEKMISYLERNMDRRSVSDPLTNALVFFHIRSGQLERAEELVMDAMERGDGSGRALAQLGYIAAGRDSREEAEQYYRQAVEKDPELRSTVNVNLAAMLIEDGRNLDAAEDLLNEALDLREGSAKSGVHINLALLSMKRGDPRQALVQALTGYELMPAQKVTARSRANALAIASRAYRDQGESEESSRLASKALKILDEVETPEDDRLYTELGHLAGS